MTEKEYQTKLQDIMTRHKQKKLSIEEATAEITALGNEKAKADSGTTAKCTVVEWKQKGEVAGTLLQLNADGLSWKGKGMFATQWVECLRNQTLVIESLYDNKKNLSFKDGQSLPDRETLVKELIAGLQTLLPAAQSEAA